MNGTRVQVRTFHIGGRSWEEVDREEERQIERAGSDGLELIGVETVQVLSGESNGETTYNVTVRARFRRAS